MNRIAVIGAGSSGLVTIKSALEEGLSPTCYEISTKVGGLWHYEEEQVPEDCPALYKSLVTNSNSIMHSFSDFPSPDNFPAFLTPKFTAQYYNMYVDAFNLRKYIRFQHRVLKVIPREDKTWTVRVINLETEKESEEEFEGVIVCSGSSVFTKTPTIPGQEDFQGIQIHSKQFRKADVFENKKVVVVGFSQSGCDVAGECCTATDTVFLSARRRGWIVPRIVEGQHPVDGVFVTRIFSLLESILPKWWLNRNAQSMVNKHCNHENMGLKPEVAFSDIVPCVNDSLVMKLVTKQVKIIGEIIRLTTNAVYVNDRKDPIETDVIIYGTGYEAKYPFLEDFMNLEEELQQKGLYKLIFPVPYPTLAFIGLPTGFGATPTLVELQARLVTRIFAGKQSLPSEKIMQDVIRKDESIRQKKLMPRWRNYKAGVDYIPYLDDIGSMIGAKPSLIKLFFTDPLLFKACLTGPLLSQQYRLTGPYKLPNAREIILNYPQNIRARLAGDG